MKAARRRISGEGDFEKGWKRLFGVRRSRDSLSDGPGSYSRPGGLRYSGTTPGSLAACVWVDCALLDEYDGRAHEECHRRANWDERIEFEGLTRLSDARQRWQTYLDDIVAILAVRVEVGRW